MRLIDRVDLQLGFSCKTHLIQLPLKNLNIALLSIARGQIAITGPRLFTCIAMTGAAAGAFIQFFLTHQPDALLVSGRVFLLGIFLAIGATVLPSFFINAALHRIPAQANATIGTLSPVATILLAVLILGEALSVRDMIGTALVLAGVGWFAIAGRAAPS
jgi:drug/metabolite transporter (DMT)-like permease